MGRKQKNSAEENQAQCVLQRGLKGEHYRRNTSERSKEYLALNFNYTLEYEVNNFLESVPAFRACVAAVQILLEFHKTCAYKPRKSVQP